MRSTRPRDSAPALAPISSYPRPENLALSMTASLLDHTTDRGTMRPRHHAGGSGCADRLSAGGALACTADERSTEHRVRVGPSPPRR